MPMFTHHTLGNVFDRATQADVNFSISFHSTSDFTYFYMGRMRDANETWWPIDFHASNGSIDASQADKLAQEIAAASLKTHRTTAR
jgi:hypothetical protein